ncbi:MAG: 1,4-beta-xylanase [Myxococcales bacterium]|nr:MAG: 1,4-beta-xylanase [Myxococcales bacterium]
MLARHVRPLLSLLAAIGASTLISACDTGGETPLGPGGNASTGGSASAAGTSSGASTGGSGGAATAGAGSSGAAGSSAGAAATDSLAAKYAGIFPIGAAVSDFHLTALEDVLIRDFNHLTCENAMKIADIHPSEDTYDWASADRIADFARSHGMKLTGHTLLWHRQTPAWMFAGVTAGDAASLELLKSRLKLHIETVVGRYADVVDNWDVVNEAISDTADKQYRDGPEGSKWFEVFGSEEYIYWAYQFAKDALEAKEPGSSAGKLYYNEYVATVKADKILKLLAWLKDDKGITLDGVGFQSHENMTWPTVTDLQTAIDKVKAAGYKVKISELDVTVYSDYATGPFVPQPAVTYTPELAARQAQRFADLFTLYRKNKDVVTSVTFWGVSDDQTWLDNEPVPSRDDFPLLYDDLHQPKPARAAIMNF